MKKLFIALTAVLLLSISVFAQFHSSLFIASGTLNGVNLDPANPIITVQPGESITGEVSLLADNGWDPNCVAPLAATPSWGEHSSSYWGINSWIPTGQSNHSTSIPTGLTAPTEPGLYYFYFAFRGEMTYANVMSLTSWAHPGGNVWNDGVDVADWNNNQAQSAIDSGYVYTQFLENVYYWTNVPAAAIRVQVGTVPVTLTLTPHNPPIQIPGGGGSFQFDIEIANNDVIDYIIDAWTTVTPPTGGPFTILMRSNMNLTAGGVIGRDDLTQYVPGTALPGDYTYSAFVRDHETWELLAEDSFPFEKLPGDDAPAHDFGWKLFGWDGEEAPAYTHPSSFILHPSSPNPFNPSTVISFELRDAGFVNLVIYDVSGREVARLVDGFQPAGMYQRTFDGSELSSGVYFACLKAEGFSQTRKMLLIK